MTTVSTHSHSIPVSNTMNHPKLRLLSPVGAEPVEYDWPLAISNKYNAASEIIETIRFVRVEFTDLGIALDNNVLSLTSNNDFYDPNSYENMKLLCDKYNKVVSHASQLWKGTSIQTEKRPSTDLLRHIIQMCYNYSIGDPHKLNKFYEPFSPEVYGETSFQFVQQMINDIGFNENDVFIDLGSGVGQVVLQVAGASNCIRCIGIEKADVPATYAEKMENKFRFWMNWFGRKYSEFNLHRGDFFDSQYSDWINNASFIFVNNYAFGPEVDHRLKSIFENLGDGAKILSSKAFCAQNFRISHRNLDDIGAIMKVKKILPTDNQSVSWTDKPVSYYLHTIDRREMELFYFENSNKSKNKNSDKKKKSTKNSLNVSNTSDSSSCNDHFSSNINQTTDEEIIPSKWTRKAWLEYTANNNVTANGFTANHIATNANSTSLTNANNVKDIPEINNCVSEKVDSTGSGTNYAKKKGNRGRPRKVAPPLLEKLDSVAKKENVTNDIAMEEVIESKLSNDVSEVVENVPQRRPGRPKKSCNNSNNVKRKTKGINFNSLEVLHEKTVLSIDSKIDSYKPPPGCVDQKLCSNNFSGPNIVVMNDELNTSEPQLMSPGSEMSTANNESKLYTPKTYDELLSLFKYQLVRFNEYIKTQEYKNNISTRINYEQKRKDTLISQINNLNKSIYEEKYNAMRDLKIHLSKFGIHTYQDFISKFKDLTTKNEELKLNLDGLTSKIGKLSDENDRILKIYNSKMKEKELEELEKKRLEELEKKRLEELEKKRFEESERKRLEDMKKIEDSLKQAAALHLRQSLLNKAALAEPVIENSEASTMKKESSSDDCPIMKQSYKELKYKKYLTSERLSSIDAQSKLVKRQSSDLMVVETESIDNFVKSNDATVVNNIESDVDKNSNSNTANPIKLDNMVDHINSMIFKALNEPGQDNIQVTPKNGEVIDSNALCNGYTANKTTAKSSRRPRKPKFEGMKNDRQVIVKNSAGCPTTQIIHTATNIAKDAKPEPISIVKPEERRYGVKLKIFCKDQKVVDVSQNSDEAIEYNNDNNKRKVSNDDSSHSNKKRSSKKETSKNLNSEELKRPPVVLKLTSNNGQCYQLKKDDNVETTTSHKKAAALKYQAELSAKQLETSVPTLKLHNTAQYVRNNPGNEDSSVSSNSIRDLATSPSISSFASSRPSSVESYTHSNTSKKSKKRSAKSQKAVQQNGTNFIPPSDNNFIYPNQNVFPPTTDNFIHNYSNQLNFIQNLNSNSNDAAKNIYNNGYMPNGLNQTNFFQQMNGNNFKNPEAMMIQKKIKDNQKNASVYNKEFYSDVNSMKQSVEPLNYYPLNNCMMDKVAGSELLTNQQPLVNHQNHHVGYDYSSLNCRYDNSAANFMPNTTIHAPNNLDPIIKKSTTDTSQINNSHNGYYNQNMIF